MFNLKWKKNWFTLAETIIVCTVFAVMILWVIFAINRAYIFLNDTRLRVMATNFSRGWVEMVYNIRDTNRRQNPGDRDEHWIDTGFTWSAKLSAWIYTIKEWKTSSGDSYLYLTGLWITQDSEIENFYEIDWFFDKDYADYKEKSKLVFTGSYSYNSGWTIATWDLNDFMNWFWATFYRIVRVYGIYCKNSTSTDDTSCSNASDPKELRFCVKVFYDVNGWHHSNELCSIMTNFAK